MNTNTWINVGDSYPNDSTWVLVYCDSPFKGKMVTMAFHEVNDEDEHFWLSHNDFDNEWEGVTHWMVLPDKP